MCGEFGGNLQMIIGPPLNSNLREKLLDDSFLYTEMCPGSFGKTRRNIMFVLAGLETPAESMKTHKQGLLPLTTGALDAFR